MPVRGRQPNDEAAFVSDERAAEVVALDDALAELAQLSLRQSQVVELRYFGGLSVIEVAAVLQVSTDTITRDWNQVKAWLYRAWEFFSPFPALKDQATFNRRAATEKYDA